MLPHPSHAPRSPLDWLKALVEIPSVSGQEKALALFCEAALQEQGFTVTRQPVSPQSDEHHERFNLLAEKRPQHASEGDLPALLLYAHLDTVPPDPGYPHSPFIVRVENGRAYGLGVSDMKGGLAVILAAVQELEPVGYTLKVALGVDEEAYSQGAWTLKDSGWCSDVALALVPELSIDSESEHLGLGRAGSLAFEVVGHGLRQHGSIPLQAPTAIEKSLQALQRLQDFPLQLHPHLPERLIINGIHASAPGLTHPDRCQAHGHLFLSPQRSAQEAFDALQAWLAPITDVELVASPRPTPRAEAYAVSETHPLVQWIQQEYADIEALTQKTTEKRDRQLPAVHGWSVADENVLSKSCAGPVLSLAPVGGASHRSGEWLDLKSLTRVVSLYQHILKKAGSFLA